MLFPHYELKVGKSSTVFEFVSVGNKGNITKVVQYLRIADNFYNLGFGDKDGETGELSDNVVSNNGDSWKVLATVAASFLIFTEKYPNAFVYATGSTRARTRLYRIGITNNLEEILEHFEVFGQKDAQFQKFEKGVEYQGFLVRRRS